MHILPQNLRFALAVPNSTAPLRCSFLEQTVLSYKTSSKEDIRCY